MKRNQTKKWNTQALSKCENKLKEYQERIANKIHDKNTKSSSNMETVDEELSKIEQ